MVTPDFSNQPYVAEILRTSTATAKRAPSAIRKLLEDDWVEDRIEDSNGEEIFIYHGSVASPIPFHRATRTVTNERGKAVEIPRRKLIRRREHFLYDLLMLRRNEHLVLAVPFHGLANWLFLRIDETFAGTRTVYERINITNMVLRLGAKGKLPLQEESDSESEIIVTRCHLAYSDPAERRRDVEQVRLTGANLGASEIYPQLVGPVLNPDRSRLTVTPILLGFALMTDAVRKSSATTDRHGNFRVTVGPGLRQVTRLFSLLDEIERLQNVVSTTSNIPILQSGAIEVE